MTNHEAEMHSVFLNVDGAVFSDVTMRSGVGPATRPYVGFGVAFFDYDNDTDLDIAIANGHVMANVSSLRGGGKFAQRNLLLRNSDGRFQVTTSRSRILDRTGQPGLAAGDVDNDGDLDLLVTNNGAGVNLLLNEGLAEAAVNANAMLIRDRDEKQPQWHWYEAHADDWRAPAAAGGAVRFELSDPERLACTLRTWRRESVRAPGDTLAERCNGVVQDLPANHVITVREGEVSLAACRSVAKPSRFCPADAGAARAAFAGRRPAGSVLFRRSVHFYRSLAVSMATRDRSSPLSWQQCRRPSIVGTARSGMPTANCDRG